MPKLKQLLLSFMLLCSIAATAQKANELYLFSTPVFGVGKNAFTEYFQTNIHISERDKKKDIRGSIRMKFRLCKDGAVKDVQILDTTSNSVFNDKALDRLKTSMFHWTPAMINKEKQDVTVIANIGAALIDGSEIHYIILANYSIVLDNLMLNNYYNMGSELATKEMYKEAIPYFSEVLQNATSDLDALYNRGVCYLKTDEIPKACEDWKRMKKLGNGDADGLIEKYCKE